VTAHNESVAAERRRAVGLLGIPAVVVILGANLTLAPLGAGLVLLWARWSGTPWRELGFVRPRSVARDLALGVALGASLKLAMKAVVMPLLGADPINRAFHFVAGNPSALPGMIFASVVVAGIGEEIVYRGFLFERLRKLFGRGALATALILVVTSAFFASIHYPEQGLAGAQQATFTGLVFGAIFLATGRIWTVMVAHAVFDITAVALIYFDLEDVVAHLVFP
jgi:membrane protease YdiL (CAAX protease family)